MKKNLQDVSAFTLIELLVVLALFAVAFALLFQPLHRQPTEKVYRIVCVNNLKQIGIAFRVWSEDASNHFPMQVSVTNGGAMEFAATGSVFLIFQVMSNELNTPKILLCPSDQLRKTAGNFTNLTDTNLSYFVGIDATTNNDPSATILAGDRNPYEFPPGGSHFVSVDNTTGLSWRTDLHNAYGNVAYADGHVEGFANFRRRNITTNMPDGITNRLAIP